MTSHIPQLHRDLLEAAHRRAEPSPALWITRTVRRPAALISAGLATAVIATGLVVGTSDPAPSSGAPETLQASFAVFRRAAQTTPSTQLTAPLTSNPNTNVPTTFDSALGSFSRSTTKSGLTVDVESARQLDVPNALVIVVPAEAAGKGLQTCLIVSGQYAAGGTAAGCDDADSVKRDGLFSYEVVDDTIARQTRISTGSHTVDGLVPDGATNVTINYGDSETAVATVKENAISTTVPGRPTSVTFTDADGAPRSFKL